MRGAGKSRARRLALGLETWDNGAQAVEARRRVGRRLIPWSASGEWRNVWYLGVSRWLLRQWHGQSDERPRAEGLAVRGTSARFEGTRDFKVCGR